PTALSKSISAVAPLKSYRWLTSLRAWFTALSTSWRSTVDVMSKVAFFAMRSLSLFGSAGQSTQEKGYGKREPRQARATEDGRPRLRLDHLRARRGRELEEIVRERHVGTKVTQLDRADALVDLGDLEAAYQVVFGVDPEADLPVG